MKILLMLVCAYLLFCIILGIYEVRHAPEMPDDYEYF